MQRGAESLVGRFHPQLICPMKFLEVIRFQYKERDPFRKYDQINWKMRDHFSEGIKKDNLQVIFDIFQWASIQLAPERDDIRIKLDDYLLRGGYPASVSIEDQYKTTEILRDYLYLTIYKDIVKTFNIRDPKTFESLFSILASECCNKHNYSNLANSLGVKRDTIKDYLFYLIHSYLISESKFYSKNIRKQARNDKKIFVNDNGLRNAVLGLINQSTLLDPIQMGKIAENTTADHCKRLKFSLGQGIDSEIFYWNNKKGQEVDIVFEIFGKSIPVEVKYRNQISKADLSGIDKFKDEYGSKVNLVVTKDKLSLDDDLLKVPLWLFLIMC
jgi:predicted AAA+ superfamily ATPase